MRAGGVVALKPVCEAYAQSTWCGVRLEVNVFILYAGLKRFDADIVDPTSLSIHADKNARVFNALNPGSAGR